MKYYVICMWTHMALSKTTSHLVRAGAWLDFVIARWCDTSPAKAVYKSLSLSDTSFVAGKKYLMYLVVSRRYPKHYIRLIHIKLSYTGHIQQKHGIFMDFHRRNHPPGRTSKQWGEERLPVSFGSSNFEIYPEVIRTYPKSASRTG